jgi:hypothetical protein
MPLSAAWESMMADSGSVKRGPRCNRRRLLRSGALVLPLILLGLPARGAERAGSVEDVTGEAFAEVDAARRTLDRAAPIYLGDDVATGSESRLGMLLGQNSKIRLGENARLRIDRLMVDAGGELTLRSGPLLFDRPPGGAHAGVRIRSPFGLIAVRGTRFFAGPSNGRFGVFVTRGAVTVTAAGQGVTVREGEGTDIASPGAPPTPVKRWAPQRVRAALESVN